ncbi:hypothetical protein Tco_0792681 [Tanacetum coccineum]
MVNGGPPPLTVVDRRSLPLTAAVDRPLTGADVLGRLPVVQSGLDTWTRGQKLAAVVRGSKSNDAHLWQSLALLANDENALDPSYQMIGLN